MAEQSFEVMAVDGGAPVKMWTRGVAVDETAREQLARAARMPFIHKQVAVMPDVHSGIGATVGSVIPTEGAMIPAAVGVDIGCGMMAVQHHAHARAICPTPWRRCARRSRRRCRTAAPTTAASATAARGTRPAGARRDGVGDARGAATSAIVDKHPQLEQRQRRSSTSARSAPATTSSRSASTRRTACGSCCTRARAASATASARYFIELAKQDMRRWFINLPDQDLAYLPEGTEHFDDYVEAVRLGAGLRAREPRADDGRA